MSIYARSGERVVIQRLATIEDVFQERKREHKRPDHHDREALKLDALVMVTHEDGDTVLAHVAYLHADSGSVEISAVIEACKKNGGRAP